MIDDIIITDQAVYDRLMTAAHEAAHAVVHWRVSRVDGESWIHDDWLEKPAPGSLGLLEGLNLDSSGMYLPHRQSYDRSPVGSIAGFIGSCFLDPYKSAEYPDEVFESWRVNAWVIDHDPALAAEYADAEICAATAVESTGGGLVVPGAHMPSDADLRWIPADWDLREELVTEAFWILSENLDLLEAYAARLYRDGYVGPRFCERWDIDHDRLIDASWYD